MHLHVHSISEQHVCIIKLSVIGSFHRAKDYLWFLRHQTTLEAYLGFVSDNNLSLTVLSLMAATSLFPFPFHCFLVESTYSSAIFFTSFLLWAIEQKRLSLCLCWYVQCMSCLSGTCYLGFILATAIFSSSLKQDSVSAYLS